MGPVEKSVSNSQKTQWFIQKAQSNKKKQNMMDQTNRSQWEVEFGDLGYQEKQTVFILKKTHTHNI